MVGHLIKSQAHAAATVAALCIATTLPTMATAADHSLGADPAAMTQCADPNSRHGTQGFCRMS